MIPDALFRLTALAAAILLIAPQARAAGFVVCEFIDQPIHIQKIEKTLQAVNKLRTVLRLATQYVAFAQRMCVKLDQIKNLRPTDFVRIRIDLYGDEANSNPQMKKWMDFMDGATDAIGDGTQFLTDYLNTFNSIYAYTYTRDNPDWKAPTWLERSYKHFSIDTGLRGLLADRAALWENYQQTLKAILVQGQAETAGSRYNHYEANTQAFSYLDGAVMLNLTQSGTAHQATYETLAQQTKATVHEADIQARIVQHTSNLEIFRKTVRLNTDHREFNQLPTQIDEAGQSAQLQHSQTTDLTLWSGGGS